MAKKNESEEINKNPDVNTISTRPDIEIKKTRFVGPNAPGSFTVKDGVFIKNEPKEEPKTDQE